MLIIYPLSKPFLSFLANKQNSPNVMYTGELLLAHFITHCIISATVRKWKKWQNVPKLCANKTNIVAKELPWAEVRYNPKSLNSAWTLWAGAFVFWEPTREFHAEHNSLQDRKKNTNVCINIILYNYIKTRKIRNCRQDNIQLLFYLWIFNYIWVQTGRNHVDATKSSDTQRQRKYFIDCGIINA